MAVNDFKQYTVSVLAGNKKETVEQTWDGDIISPIAAVITAMEQKKTIITLKIECALKRRLTADMWVARITKYINGNSVALLKQLQAAQVKITGIDVGLLCNLLFDTAVNDGISYKETKDNLEINVEFSKDIIKQIKKSVVF